MSQTILVVDDAPSNLLTLSGLLGKRYRVIAVRSGEKALEAAARTPSPDLILLDLMMPGMDGFEVIRQLKSDPRTRAIPVIFLTANTRDEDEERGLELGAVDYINKPIKPAVTLRRIEIHLENHNQRLALENAIRERTDALNNSRLEIIHRLSTAAEFKDDDTGLHIVRMSQYSALLAEASGLPQGEVETIANSAPMHDVGKIGVPDAVLKKPGRLTEEEWVTMRRHCEWGARIIGEHQDTLLSVARVIALGHHEKWDGSGYPGRLAGESIPFYARIVAIADVFDALTSSRPYKRAWSYGEAMKLIEEGAGSHFDPELAHRFLLLEREIREVMERYADPEVPAGAMA
jgi:putative two-component system response regulator